MSCLRGDPYYQSLLNDDLSSYSKSAPSQPNSKICHGVGDWEYAVWPVMRTQGDVERQSIGIYRRQALHQLKRRISAMPTKSVIAPLSYPSRALI